MLRNVDLAYDIGFVIGCVSVIFAYTYNIDPLFAIALSFLAYLAGAILLRIKTRGKE